MRTLLLRHVAGSHPPHFFVERPGGKSTPPALVPSPVGFPIAGRPKSDLWRELGWYLEEFLGYPFSPETEHAERVLDALRDWGKKAFDALFDSREGGKLIDDATARYDADYAGSHREDGVDCAGGPPASSARAWGLRAKRTIMWGKRRRSPPDSLATKSLPALSLSWNGSART